MKEESQIEQMRAALRGDRERAERRRRADEQARQPQAAQPAALRGPGFVGRLLRRD